MGTSKIAKLTICLILLVITLTSSCTFMSREPEVLELNVTFDGTDCIYEGPDDFKAGPVVLTFYNNNDTISILNFVYFEDGKTTQDQVDHSSVPDPGHAPLWANDNKYYTYDFFSYHL